MKSNNFFKQLKFTLQNKKTQFLCLAFVFSFAVMHSQAPGYDWKKTTYRDKDLMNNPGLSHANSGDEWWFSHTNLYDNNGNQIGYMAVGYIADLVHPGDYNNNVNNNIRTVFNEGTDSPASFYPGGNLFLNGEDLTPPVSIIGNHSYCGDFYNVMGSSATTNASEGITWHRGMLARLDMQGNMLWCRLPIISGDGLADVVQPAGQDYVYVIGNHPGAKNMNFSSGKTFLAYNPDANNHIGNSPNNFNKITYTGLDPVGHEHMYVAKYHIDGTKQWEAIYGNTDFSNPVNAWNDESKGIDIIYHSDDYLYAVGSAISNGINHVFIAKINPSNGYLVSKTILPLPSSLNFNGFPCTGAIARSICEISNGKMVVGGSSYYPLLSQYVYDDAERGVVYSIEQNLTLNSGWTTNPQVISSTLQQSLQNEDRVMQVWDVSSFSNKTEVLVGVAADRTGNRGKGRVYRYDASNGNLSSGTNPSDMGDITAFDLRVGVVETSDGGFAAVSSSRRNNTFVTPTSGELGIFANCSPFNFNFTYWDSDPLIMKFDANGDEEWQWCEDVEPGRSRNLALGDVKLQECMYKITEAEDGGLVISGNNSIYHDDNYMVKLYSTCNMNQDYDDGINGVLYNGQYELNITSNVTWSSSHSIIGKLIIQSGAVLTITGNTTKIRFADSRACGVDTYIEVQPGGKLIVEDGAELTSIDNAVCPGSMWDGISLLGNSSAGQGAAGNYNNITTQGCVIMNDATISNARCAITTAHIEPYNRGKFFPGVTGGVIKATDSYFINNNRDVELWNYTNPDNAQMNKCSFTKCHFVTDNRINNGEPPVYHIFMSNVIGVSLKGNEFAYTAGNAYDQYHRGYGIKSDDSKYTVQDYTGGIRSEFSELTYAIAADNCNSLRVVNIDHAIFSNSSAFSSPFASGIWFSSVYTGKITRCDFNLALYNIGISVNNSKNYNINNNNIAGVSANKGIGMYLSNSGDGVHKVYKNTLSDLSFGIIPQFNNSPVDYNTNSNDGLIMNCNIFDNHNTFDIYQFGSVMKNQGILTIPNNAFQSEPRYFVRNWHSNINSNHQWYVFGSSENIFHPSFADAETRPLPPYSISGGNVQVENSGQSYDSQYCLFSESFPGLEPNAVLSLNDINEALFSAQDLVNTLSGSYAAAIDGGNTQHLLDVISSGTVSVGDVKDLLSANSPYLSDTVLKAYFSNATLSYPDDIIEIHNLNKPVSEHVWVVIENRDLEPENMEILEAQQQDYPVSARQAMADELGRTEAELQFICGQKLNYFLSDTLETSADSVLQFLIDDPGHFPDAKLLRVRAYAGAGYYERAFAYADSLVSVDEYISIMPLQKALLELDTAAMGLNKIITDETLHGVINAYATYTTTEGCWLARAVLRHVYGTDMGLEYLIPVEEDIDSRLAAQTNEQDNKADKPNTSIGSENYVFSVYPNPNKGTFNLLYQGQSNTKLQFTISDILGRNVLQSDLYSNKPFEVNQSDLNRGIYFITLIQSNKVLARQKVIIMD